MEITQEMAISLAANFSQLIFSLAVTQWLTMGNRKVDRGTWYILLWLVYDAVIHFTLVSTEKAVP